MQLRRFPDGLVAAGHAFAAIQTAAVLAADSLKLFSQIVRFNLKVFYNLGFFVRICKGVPYFFGLIFKTSRISAGQRLINRPPGQFRMRLAKGMNRCKALQNFGLQSLAQIFRPAWTRASRAAERGGRNAARKRPRGIRIRQPVFAQSVSRGVAGLKAGLRFVFHP